MSEYAMTVEWERGAAAFIDKRYSRAHTMTFDGGAVVPGSSSPHSVPIPYSDPAGVDPEEAFVAALASCHMLWFLSIAAARGFVVDQYRDHAVGVMERNEAGAVAMTRVTLRPHTIFSGAQQPTTEDVHAMHHTAHHECYIANSVKSVVETEPTWEIAANYAAASADSPA